ncbi:MAG: multiheme c-type cytochrome [Planctomycetaceae bacterium]
MMKHVNLLKLRWLAAVVLGITPVGVVSQAFGQVAAPSAGSATPESDPVFLSWQKQPAVQACGRCHYQPAGGFAKPDVSFSRQDELQFWLANDKHAIARRRVEPLNAEEITNEAAALMTELSLTSLPKDWFGLSNALSRRICDKLGYEVTTPAGYTKFRDNCLTCHGGYRGASDDQDFAKDGGAQPGISCNYCHQIDDNTAWIDQHGGTRAATEWRNLPPAEKASAGMRDLVSAANQAAYCYDCHIGNRDKNMFVTHVMYAAGHPPLPGIELQTFNAAMPQHWQSESQLHESLASFNGRDEYFRANYPSLFGGDEPPRLTPDKTFWNTRKIIVGALAAKLHSVELLSDSAVEDRWGDYSLYDCAACHHELREPSARQQRGYAAAPGRPRQAEWPEAILGVALDVAGADMRTQVEATEAKLSAAFSQTPFGEPNLVAPIAAELAAMLQSAIDSAQSKPISAVAGREVIRRLALTPKDRLLVYDSARQVVWAIQGIAAELESEGEPLPVSLAQKIAALSDVSLTGVDTALPASRQKFIYPEHLNAELERKAAFSADRLAGQLQAIAQEIVVRPPAPSAAP